MHRDGYAVLASRLRGLQMDLGSSFQTELQRGEVEVRATLGAAPWSPALQGPASRHASPCLAPQFGAPCAAAPPPTHTHPHPHTHTPTHTTTTTTHPPAGPLQSSLTITRCIYHDIFSAEGKPQLAFTSCCSQDKVWFEVRVARPSLGGCLPRPPFLASPTRPHYRPRFPAVQVPYRGVTAGRTAVLSAGDPCCRFTVQRVQHGG